MSRHQSDAGSFLSRWVGAPLAAVAVVGLLAGGPMLLLALGGNPLPTRLPDLASVTGSLTTPDDGRMLLWLLTATGWGAWAVLAASVLLELGAQIAGRGTPQVPGLGGPQRLARLLVAAALAAVTASSISPAHAAYVDAADRPAAAGAAADKLVHEVAEGDWMWHIAGRYLGDEHRYPEIAALNPGYAEQYAGFPDHIQPGDRLVLPTDASDRGERPHAAGVVAGWSPAPEVTPGGSEAPNPAPPRAVVPEAPPPPVPHSPDPEALRPAPEALRPAPEAAVTTDRSASPAGLLAAGVLASVLVGALAWRRVRKRAFRRPGRSVADPGHAPTEAALRAAATVDTGRLDQALRLLATAPGAPDVGAVWIADGDIHLVLASDPEQSPPAPFHDDGDGGWTLPAGTELPEVPGGPAPLPGLVTLASTPGRHLLVDLERLGMLTVTGDPDRCGDLVRHLVAELAHNPWSDLAEVILTGFTPRQANTLASLNPERIRADESVRAAVERATRHVVSAADALARHGVHDARLGRITGMAADTWVPRLLVVDRPTSEDLAALSTLDCSFPPNHRRCAVAVVVNASGDTPTGPVASSPGVPVTVTSDGMLHLTFLLDWEPLPAACLPDHLVEEVAGLLHDAADPADHPMVPPATARVLRADTPTMPLPVIGNDQDWQTLVPRVELLGPVRVVAAGPAPAWRARLCQELVVLMAAAGSEGLTGPELSARLWPAEPVPATVRTEVLTRTRRWLGEAPDGAPWLSEADADGRYRLRTGLPVDVHRFRQLRARAGRADDPAGIDDLRDALRLVRGAPLAGAEVPGTTEGVRVGYSWVANSPFAPELILAGVLDTAHELAERCLAAGDLDTAYWAVQQAWLADPQRTDDHPWQDLLRIAAARGGLKRVRQVLSDLLRCREAEHLDNLAPATRDLAAHLLAGPTGAAGDPAPDPSALYLPVVAEMHEPRERL